MVPQSSSPKSPSFTFCPADYMSDPKVKKMTHEEKGLYITLLCYCCHNGSLPDDTVNLSRLCKVKLKPFEKMWANIKTCFLPSKDEGRLTHPYLESEG